MSVLIVYAHPEPKSFNGAMKDAAVETLRGAGPDVAVSDLYAMRFNPVVGPGDFWDERADAGARAIKIERPASGAQRLLCATPEQDGGLNLEVRTANGNVTMKAEAKW